MRGLTAVQAYSRSADHRSPREQEADVFRRINGRLRAAQNADAVIRARALADNELLWIAVMDLVGDPGNGLPVPLRASILSVGHAVRRETKSDSPDLVFLMGINDQIASGLVGQ